MAFVQLRNQQEFNIPGWIPACAGMADRENQMVTMHQTEFKLTQNAVGSLLTARVAPPSG
jgi:hypothetical protein